MLAMDEEAFAARGQHPDAEAGELAVSDVGEQVTRNDNLGHLERDVAPVAHDLRSDLDELLSQAGQ